MKKNNKGFFLAEAIVMIALVTTVMAFVYPNVSKLYENYVNKTKYYDQIEDIYALKAAYEILLDNGYISTITTGGTCASPGGLDLRVSGKLEESNNAIPQEKYNYATFGSDSLTLYLINYTSTPTAEDYDFRKYLRRMKISTYDSSSYRLIGKFTKDDNVSYASIKIENPNPYRTCNLGGA